MNLSCGSSSGGAIESYRVYFTSRHHLHPSFKCPEGSLLWIFEPRPPGNRLICRFEVNPRLFWTAISPYYLFHLSYFLEGTTKPSPFHPTMVFFGAFILRLTLLLWFTVSLTFALPTHHGRGLTAIHRIIHVETRNVIVDDSSGTVVNSGDQSRVDQGSASDGAGSGFDVPAVLWLSFGLAVGLYLTFCGMRLWRMTTAFAVGLVFVLCG